MPTFSVVNLGCSKNVIDGERMIHRLLGAGYRLVSEPGEADLILVNTCAFIEPARREALSAIREMARHKKTGRCRKLVVTGCFAQRFRGRSARLLPEVDLWCGVHDWPKAFADLLAADGVRSWERTLTGSRFSQYLKIAEGCSHACSYCVIPAIRGKLTSRDPGELIREAGWLYEQGVRECILVAQDTSRYGTDIGASLTGLCETMLQKTAFPWIRIMYLHPACVDDDLIGLIASEKRMCPYFDIPVQHCCDDILKAMRRAPGKAGILRLFDRIRGMAPGAVLRTTMITGFPGETADHFKELLSFCAQVRFDKLGVFPYSPEEGTPARLLPNRPGKATASRRAELLMAAQRDISRENLRRRIGQDAEVLIEGRSYDRAYQILGRSKWDAPGIDGTVFLKAGAAREGQFVKASIVDSNDYDLFASISSPALRE